MQTKDTQMHGMHICVSAQRYTVSQHRLATIMHRYVFILSVPIVTTEIEFPLELWYNDSLFFAITNEKIRNIHDKLETM